MRSQQEHVEYAENCCSRGTDHLVEGSTSKSNVDKGAGSQNDQDDLDHYKEVDELPRGVEIEGSEQSGCAEIARRSVWLKIAPLRQYIELVKSQHQCCGCQHDE